MKDIIRGVTKTRVKLFIVLNSRTDSVEDSRLNILLFFVVYEDANELRVGERQNEVQACGSDRCGGFGGSTGYYHR